MSCFHGKETFFGRSGGYHVCREFNRSGVVRCLCGDEKKCALFFDDGKGDDRTTKLQSLRDGECARSELSASIAVGRLAKELTGFFDGALAQSPDGGDAYYDAEDKLLPHRLMSIF